MTSPVKSFDVSLTTYLVLWCRHVLILGFCDFCPLSSANWSLPVTLQSSAHIRSYTVFWKWECCHISPLKWVGVQIPSPAGRKGLGILENIGIVVRILTPTHFNFQERLQSLKLQLRKGKDGWGLFGETVQTILAYASVERLTLNWRCLNFQFAAVVAP